MHSKNESIYSAEPIEQDYQLDPLTETALEWLVKLHSGHQTETDWQEYDAWKMANSQQTAAAIEAENLWDSLGTAIKPPSSNKIKKSITNLVFVFTIIGIILASVINHEAFNSPASLFADIRTSKGEINTLILSDGSKLQIDTSTSLDINFSENKRQLTLHTGQIHVNVTPDKNRPFEVITGKGVIQALGTAFNVRHLNDRSEVIVTEHSVKITLNNESTVLTNGYQLDYDETELGTPRIANINSQTAWLRERFIFNNTSLSDVIKELQRYSTSKIIFLDSELKTRKITGIFNTKDTHDLLDTIETILPIKVYRLPLVTLIDSP
jgi:transmembrane sensor